MPSSLRFVLLLIVTAAIAAPISIAVVHGQDVSAARINAEAMTHGDSARGKAAIRRHGCGACHSIAGINDADGQVGPPLATIASRTEIAGVLPNQPDQMIRWLRHPQAVLPGNGMPDLGLSEAEARDIAAYLYTLRQTEL